MKFSRLFLLCFTLSGISALTTIAKANVFDEYLTVAKSPAASQNYDLLEKKGGFNPKWKEAVGAKGEKCDRLTTAKLLAESHREFVLDYENDKGDGSEVVQSIDRLSVATNLLREGKVRAVATPETDQHYLLITYTKAINLAVRLNYFKDLASVFGLFSQDFGGNLEGKTAEDKLHFQLAALTLHFYAEIVEAGSAFGFLGGSYKDRNVWLSGLTTLLTTHSDYISTMKLGFEPKEGKKKGYKNKAKLLYSNPEQRFIDIRVRGLKGIMRSAPRTLFLMAHTHFIVKGKNAVVTAIEKASEVADKDDEGFGVRFMASLETYFSITTPEQWQYLVHIHSLVDPECFEPGAFSDHLRDPRLTKSGLKPKLLQLTDWDFLKDKDISFWDGK